MGNRREGQPHKGWKKAAKERFRRNRVVSKKIIIGLTESLAYVRGRTDLGKILKSHENS